MVVKRPGDVLSFSIREGLRGPVDMVAGDGSYHTELSGDLRRDVKSLQDAGQLGCMDDVDEELADYLCGGGAIKLGRGFSKPSPMLAAPEEKHRKGGPVDRRLDALKPSGDDYAIGSGRKPKPP